MNLLDRGVKMAAEADEDPDMNFVRKHALAQAEVRRKEGGRKGPSVPGIFSPQTKPSSPFSPLSVPPSFLPHQELGVSVRDAATRVFSNAAGSYSANVGLTIENGGWDGEAQLQEQFVSRKVRIFPPFLPPSRLAFPRIVAPVVTLYWPPFSVRRNLNQTPLSTPLPPSPPQGFAFNADKPGMMEQRTDAFRSALKSVDVTFQNLDSSEISLTDVSHYYDRCAFRNSVRPSLSLLMFPSASHTRHLPNTSPPSLTPALPPSLPPALPPSLPPSLPLSDPTKVVQSLRDDKKKPMSFIADTTTANAQVWRE